MIERCVNTRGYKDTARGLALMMLRIVDELKIQNMGYGIDASVDTDNFARIDVKFYLNDPALKAQMINTFGRDFEMPKQGWMAHRK